MRKPTSKAGSIRAARTPEPMEGRRHMDIQTDTYLEELTDTVPEADTCTQTDAFMDRPPTPVFVPAKTGGCLRDRAMEKNSSVGLQVTVHAC